MTWFKYLEILKVIRTSSEFGIPISKHQLKSTSVLIVSQLGLKEKKESLLTEIHTKY